RTDPASLVARPPRRDRRAARARGARGRAVRQGRVVGSAPRRLRDHLPRKSEPAARPHGVRASTIDAASLRRRDPYGGVGRRLLGARRGFALGPERARLAAPARRARASARVPSSLDADDGGIPRPLPGRESGMSAKTSQLVWASGV